MIEIKNRVDRKTRREICYINGVPATDTSASKVRGENWELYTDDDYVRELLLSMPIDQLKEQFLALNMVLTDSCHQLINRLFVHFPRGRPHSIGFLSEHDETTWEQPFRIGAFLDALQRVGESFKVVGASVTTSFDDMAIARVSFAVNAPASQLSSEAEQHAPIARELFETALDEARAQIPPDSLIAHFRFPKEIKAACIQYLSYFAQFLRDVGTEDAKVTISENTQQVLFSVSPASGAEALWRVREALTAYLRLPSSPDFFQSMPQTPDLAVAQLAENVRHLRVQIDSIRAAAGVRNTMFDSSNLLDYGQFPSSTDRKAGKYPVARRDGSENTEPLLGKIVAVTKFRIWGLEIDLPALLRMLKR